MITENGRVVAIKGDQLWVQTIQLSACNTCSAKQGCGQRVLAGVTAGRANQVLVDNVLGARVGDVVTLAIEESALLRASLLVYALPLIFLVVGAVAGHQLAPSSDGWALVLSGLGMGLGFVVVHRQQKHHGQFFRPQLLRIEKQSIDPTIY
ncbi:SoxR reducing system RseC family protein [Marinobacter caseinilyticus]|uniref:SoxR reducing system RseC family protein n=1 Tax=Marinobacter caseinilyticus TaxID=2692195 RepID=UPI001408D07F|nr:SoxR reducing system RseC family protein [Marinobacter caseinilyticus]